MAVDHPKPAWRHLPDCTQPQKTWTTTPNPARKVGESDELYAARVAYERAQGMHQPEEIGCAWICDCPNRQHELKHEEDVRLDARWRELAELVKSDEGRAQSFSFTVRTMIEVVDEHEQRIERQMRRALADDAKRLRSSLDSIISLRQEIVQRLLSPQKAETADPQGDQRQPQSGP